MRTALIIAVLALGAFPFPSFAQSKNAIRFSEEIIRGKVQKPEVMMVITRQNLNSNYVLELRESFLPRIVDSVEAKPF